LTTIRIATFNVENLFARLAFADAAAPGEEHVGLYRFDDPEERKLARRIVEAAASDDKRQLTALALAATRADVVCLQEVDNAHALKVFYDRYLRSHIDPAAASGRRAVAEEARRLGRVPRAAEFNAVDRRHYYDERIVIEGNDGRGIDIGLLSKLPVQVTSHAARSFDELGVWSAELAAYRETIDGRERTYTPADRLFRRDCLEIDVDTGGAPLTVFACHLKSMAPERSRTRVLRQAEALGVRRLIEARFGPRVADANWLVCGDMNDYAEIDGAPELDATGRQVPHGLGPLLDGGFAVNLVARRPPLDRWTTYYAPLDLYTQLDFILASPALARANPDAVPEVIRGGQPYRARRHEGPRFPRVGWDRPKASDHCPVVVELEVPGL
jgi:endonuclease/exonuclease/phosphatase family metal-dependent hydrolase